MTQKQIKSLYNLNTKLENLMPSLKVVIYNKIQCKNSIIRIINKEF